MRTGAAFLLGEARRHDPDRYLCALLAPADRRATLIALTVFNHELARVPEVVSQPLAGMIRLQWWRDAIDELVRGEVPRRQPVVEAMAEAIAKGRVSPRMLHALIDAREPALERPAPDSGKAGGVCHGHKRRARPNLVRGTRRTAGNRG